MTEDEMAGWHHRLDGREFEWTPGVGDGQGGLARCNSWGLKEMDTTEWLNWTEPKFSWCYFSLLKDSVNGVYRSQLAQQPDIMNIIIILLQIIMK